MLRAVESSQLLPEALGVNGAGVGVPFEAHGIGIFAMALATFSRLEYASAEITSSPDGKQRSLFKNDHQAARLHADLNAPGVDFGLQFFGEDFQRGQQFYQLLLFLFREALFGMVWVPPGPRIMALPWPLESGVPPSTDAMAELQLGRRPALFSPIPKPAARGLCPPGKWRTSPRRKRTAG